MLPAGFSLKVLNQWIRRGYIRVTDPIFSPTVSLIGIHAPDWFVIQFAEDALAALSSDDVDMIVTSDQIDIEMPEDIEALRKEFQKMDKERQEIIARSAINAMSDKNSALVFRRVMANTINLRTVFFLTKVGLRNMLQKALALQVLGIVGACGSILGSVFSKCVRYVSTRGWWKNV